MRRALAAIALIAAFCGRRTPEPSRPAAVAEKKAAVVAPANLLEIRKGAAVVSRTAEAVLTASALRGIDGDEHTMWVSPPSDPQQVLVYSLPARARIDQVGIRATNKQEHLPGAIRFDLSIDGKTFTPVATITAKATNDPQLVRIAPTEAAFVRANVLSGSGALAQVGTFYAAGTLLDAVRPGDMSGCFSIDGFPSSFTREGAEVTGTIGGDDGSSFEGGSDGRFYRFAWIRGAQFGLAAISVTPDGQHLSGLVWHEEAIQATQFFANDLLGDRVPCRAPAAAAVSVFRAYLSRFRYFPLFGLRFDDRGDLMLGESAATLHRVTAFLIANPALPVRFAAHELLQSTPELNRRLSQARLDSLRAALQKEGVNLAHVTFVALGAEQPHREAPIDLTRAMYSSVDLELNVAR